MHAALRRIAELVDNDAVPGLPRLRNSFQHDVLIRQRVRTFNEGVDTVRICVQRSLGIVGTDFVVRLGNPREVAPSHKCVAVRRFLPDIFTEPAKTVHAILVHLPQPVLSRGISLRKEKVVEIVRTDVWHAPGIAVHLGTGPYRLVAHWPPHVWQMIGWTWLQVRHDAKDIASHYCHAPIPVGIAPAYCPRTRCGSITTLLRETADRFREAPRASLLQRLLV